MRKGRSLHRLVRRRDRGRLGRQMAEPIAIFYQRSKEIIMRKKAELAPSSGGNEDD